MMSAPRIVSLLPSATEILCCLGLESYIVGRSHECDYPPGLEYLPVCTLSKLGPSHDSLDIHNKMGELLRNALAVYEVKTDVLKSLEPTHIITQDQCDVCAVSLADVKQAVGCLVSPDVSLHCLAPQTLGGILQSIQDVAVWLEVPEAGAKVLENAWSRIRRVTDAAEKARARPTVACIEWIEPLMASGNWVPEMVERAGGINLFGENGQHSPWLEPERLIESNPDVIIVKPCGFSLEGTIEACEPLLKIPGWDDLKAVRDGRVYVTDGNQYFNRPGPRIVDSLEILGEMLQPEIFPPNLRDAGAWCRLEGKNET